jgi:hypothetical protein
MADRLVLLLAHPLACRGFRGKKFSGDRLALSPGNNRGNNRKTETSENPCLSTPYVDHVAERGGFEPPRGC